MGQVDTINRTVDTGLLVRHSCWREKLSLVRWKQSPGLGPNQLAHQVLPVGVLVAGGVGTLSPNPQGGINSRIWNSKFFPRKQGEHIRVYFSAHVLVVKICPAVLG